MFRKVVFEVFFSRFCALRRALKIPLLTLVSLPIRPHPLPPPQEGKGLSKCRLPNQYLASIFLLTMVLLPFLVYAHQRVTRKGTVKSVTKPW